MFISNLSVQPRLFKDKESKELFRLGSREINPKAPDWLMGNAYALDLRKREVVSFEIKRKLTPKEQLLEKANLLGISVGDGVTIANLEQLILNKEKQDE